MAHELTIRASGAAEMAYTGETPWHGLGQSLQPGATIEQWLAAAGMDWRIQRAKVRYPASPMAASDPSLWHTLSDRLVLHRSDTGAALGIVSDRYKVVQPAEVLEFFRDLTRDQGMVLETAGTLFGGKRLWALAKFGEDIVATGDKVGGYVLLATACDGSMVTEARRTTVRVVCNNTLGMARAERRAGTKSAPGVVKVRHSTEFDARAVQREMGLAQEDFAHTMQLARRLSQARITDAALREYVSGLLRKPGAEAEAQPQAVAVEADASPFGQLLMGAARLPDAQQRPATVAQVLSREHPGEAKIIDLFYGQGRGSSLPGTAGTAWGALNAVTEYVDYHARGKTASHRFNSATFGPGDVLKSLALTRAVEMFAQG